MTFFYEYVKNFSNVYALSIDEKKLLIAKNKSDKIMEVILRDFQVRYQKQFSVKPLVILSEGVNSFDQIKSAYKHLDSISEREFVLYNQGIIHVIDKDEESFVEEDISMEIEELITYIEVGNMKEIQKYMAKLEYDFVISHMNSDMIRTLCYSCIIKIRMLLIQKYEHVFEETVSEQDFLSEFYQLNSLGEMMSYMQSYMIDISKEIIKISPKNMMNRLINYVEANYTQELRLETLAELFNYSPSYLGKVFKKYTGEYFNTYIDTYRIEKAKILILEDQMKVYKVAETVGYKNVNYFYGKFKKYVGISPKEYRKQSIQVSG